MTIPITKAKKMNHMMLSILWGAGGRKGTHCVKKESTTLPKGMGGLGVRSTHLMNQALLMKQTWKVFSQPHSLLARVLGMNFQSSMLLGNATKRNYI